MKTKGPIGILCLDEPASESPARTWGEHPKDFTVGMIRQTVAGVSVPDIINKRDHVRRAYVDAALALKDQGCSVISSNCGYSILYQRDVCTVAQVPTLLSSLQILPAVAAAYPPDYRIGIICYDATCLSDEHLHASWPNLDRSRLAIIGVEGSEAWHKSNSSDAVYDWDLFGEAIYHRVETLRRLEPLLGAVIVECCAFGSFVPMIREKLGVPTIDIYDVAKPLLGGHILHNC
ncbi:hypothetical protein GGD56_007138 [Rhizobium mongolense]|uniref:Asp/Glu/hydantoin racemase n=2 Tax=Rhizobium mongolense TaxID=57676 RepID=A0ABR6IZA3_9HYPH|nr:hypothetical protein [Rhizobium mongolense]TVZ74952.1 hypothetical protein BCL32_0295 [Rhizobium mongolense USDA 1844]